MRKPTAVPGDPAIDPVCQPRAARGMKGESPEKCAGEPCHGLANRSGARENMVPLVDEMKLFTTALSRYARKALF